MMYYGKKIVSTTEVNYSPVSSTCSYFFNSNGVNSRNDNMDAISDDDNQTRQSIFEKKLRANIFPKITFLGTGASWPGVIKNVSGILVHTS